jgi:hypothetical protein
MNMDSPESSHDPADFDQRPQTLGEAVEQSRADVGARLDQDHAPETNGRMSICRKCGLYTNAASGGHAPNDNQLASAEKWLDGRVLDARLARSRADRDT